MNNDNEFRFNDIAGQQATLEINSRGNHCVITWGALLISDESGHIGFWETFKSTAKGAARAAALRKHARETIEAKIYEQVQFMQEERANA